MKYRFTEIVKSESIATAGTRVEDLNLMKPISRITIRVKGTNNGSTPTAHPAKICSLIEVVDGSDVIYSCSGVQAYAMNFFEMKEVPFTINETENNIQCCATYHLNFGRYLWDREFALDPSKFRNLQIRITHNKANGGSAPDAGTLAIFAHVFDDGAPNPGKFLMTKEVYDYTLTASGHEYVDLPEDFPYRKLLVQSHSGSNPLSGQVSNIKFTLDYDRVVLINDVSTSELLKAFLPHDLVEEQLAVLGTGSAVANFIVSSYENYGVGVGRSHANAGIIVAQPSGSNINITSDSSESAAIFVRGLSPFGALDIMNVDETDPSTWLDPRQHQSIRLDLTGGSGASGTTQIVVHQARPYQ